MRGWPHDQVGSWQVGQRPWERKRLEEGCWLGEALSGEMAEAWGVKQAELNPFLIWDILEASFLCLDFPDLWAGSCVSLRQLPAHRPTGPEGPGGQKPGPVLAWVPVPIHTLPRVVPASPVGLEVSSSLTQKVASVPGQRQKPLA